MIKYAICGLILGMGVTSADAAGAIERACKQSGRVAANARLCACIQKVANISLTAADQRLAAKFFKNPHRAQEIRQSDNRSHEAFWQRYKTFGARAQNYCATSKN